VQGWQKDRKLEVTANRKELQDACCSILHMLAQASAMVKRNMTMGKNNHERTCIYLLTKMVDFPASHVSFLEVFSALLRYRLMKGIPCRIYEGRWRERSHPSGRTTKRRSRQS